MADIQCIYNAFQKSQGEDVQLNQCKNCSFEDPPRVCEYCKLIIAAYTNKHGKSLLQSKYKKVCNHFHEILQEESKQKVIELLRIPQVKIAAEELSNQTDSICILPRDDCSSLDEIDGRGKKIESIINTLGTEIKHIIPRLLQSILKAVLKECIRA